MVIQRPYLTDDASAMIFRVRANFANNFTCSVPICNYYYNYRYNYPDCYIDWGDGTVEYVTSENYQTARTHTYEGLTEGTDFEVKITGQVPALSSGGADSGITHVLQWGNTGLRSMNSAFDGNNRLESIPADNTGAFAEVTSFYECFYGCSSLTDLPEGLFANCPNVTSFESCFRDCSSLTEVPVSLFDNNRMVLNFEWTFYGCYLSGESPYTEIDGVKYHLYERCNAPDHFKTPTSYGGCFINGNNLTDWDSIPSDWILW
jgi:hypothetical protein